MAEGTPVVTRTWTELSHPIDAGVAKMPFLPAPTFDRIDDATLRATEVTVATHVGTHLEAPRHLSADGAAIDDYPAERWITEGVVAAVDAAPREAIEREDLDLPAPPGPGEALLLRTGWEERVGDESYFDQPYLSEDLAAWIADRGCSWVGVDSPSPEMPGSIRTEEPFPYPVHTALLDEDVLIAEHLTNLAGLTGERVEVIALPLRYAESDGAHARIVARPL
jgi:kynurenine formamidase